MIIPIRAIAKVLITFVITFREVFSLKLRFNPISLWCIYFVIYSLSEQYYSRWL